MLKAFKDPRSACWVIPAMVMVATGIGGFLSVPDYVQAKTKEEHRQKAINRLSDCYFLKQGKVKQGSVYVVIESGREVLLSDGEFICDRFGQTAQIKDKAAAFLRRADQKAFTEQFDISFPKDENGTQNFRVAQESRFYKADPSKRITPKEPTQLGWWESYESILKQFIGN